MPQDQTFNTTRLDGVIDAELMKSKRITWIGCGGASGLATGLVRCALQELILVDHDVVTATNMATQGYPAMAVGKPKVEALATQIRAINSRASIERNAVAYEDLSEADRERILSCDLVLGMTDNFRVQAMINRDVAARGGNAIFAICYPGCGEVEVTGTFRRTVERGGGCHRCHTKARYDAYDDGFINPAVIPSHAIAAEYLNALIGHIVLGWLHHDAGSSLPIAEIGQAFAERPCLLSRIFPSSTAEAANPSALLSPMTSQLYEIDTPTGWRCPDCGTIGSC